MDSTDGRGRWLEREAERYRDAADLALDQLQWVINYLHQIRKPQLAHGLETNRNTIIERYGL